MFDLFRTLYLNDNKEEEELEKEIQTQQISHKSALKNKFESIKNEYQNIIRDYSYLADPLLNVVYPQFLRNG